MSAESEMTEVAVEDRGVAVGRRRGGRWWWLAAILLAVAGWMVFREDWPDWTDLIERAALVDASEAFAAPGGAHRWGTDHEGRDVFSRVLVGAAGTVCVAVLVGLISYMAGTLLGIARSFARAPLLEPAAAMTRAWFCFPMFFVVAAFVSLSGGRTWHGFAVLAIAGSLMVARSVAATLSRTMAHASDKAALASAIPRARLWRNYRAPHARYAGYRGAWAVLPFALFWEASLGFIGEEVAVSPFGLGHLVREGRPYFLDAPWLVLIPGAALMSLVFLARLGEAATGARFERHYSLLDDVE